MTDLEVLALCPCGEWAIPAYVLEEFGRVVNHVSCGPVMPVPPSAEVVAFEKRVSS